MKILLDRGHGGEDPGAVHENIREVDLNTQIVKALKSLLEPYVEVALTCPYDKNLSLYDRAKQGRGYDLLISCHFNKGGGNGFEIWTEIPREKGHARYKNYVDGVNLAILICDRMKSITNIRGVKQRAIQGRNETFYGIIRDCPCPAILIENAFIDTPDDIKKFDIEKAAQLQYEAIMEFFGGSMTVNEGKEILKTILSDTTIDFLYNYRYGDDLIIKLAKAIKEKEK